MFLKDDNAALDYAVDWTEACAGVRTIASSAWTVEPAGLDVSLALMGPTQTSVRLGGGVAGTVYRVGNRVGFSDGTADERTLAVRVEKR